LEAGRKAFANKGLGGASLREDILLPAGVSVGSFYHQFADKEDLLVEILRCDSERVLRTMRESGASLASDPLARGRMLLNDLFKNADRHPQFVKIFVREYYSDSPAVRRQIRKHQHQSIARLGAYYQALGEAMDLPLDANGIATMLSVQTLAMVNYYLEFPKSKRKAMRERMVTNMMQLIMGGVLAVRRADAPPRDDAPDPRPWRRPTSTARRGGSECP